MGETDNAILPDGTKAHLLYVMDDKLYIKVYKGGITDSKIIYEGNVLNI